MCRGHCHSKQCLGEGGFRESRSGITAVTAVAAAPATAAMILLLLAAFPPPASALLLTVLLSAPSWLPLATPRSGKLVPGKVYQVQNNVCSLSCGREPQNRCD